MSNVHRTVGKYIIEVTLPVWNTGEGREILGHRTIQVATYSGERWRAKHHARTHWAKLYPEGNVTVRWIGNIE